MIWKLPFKAFYQTWPLEGAGPLTIWGSHFFCMCGGGGWEGAGIVNVERVNPGNNLHSSCHSKIYFVPSWFWPRVWRNGCLPYGVGQKGQAMRYLVYLLEFTPAPGYLSLVNQGRLKKAVSAAALGRLCRDSWKRSQQGWGCGCLKFCGFLFFFQEILYCSPGIETTMKMSKSKTKSVC